MNYTKNYRLPQWIKSDRIMMEDFNAMNSSIESGLTTANTNASAANTKADAAVQTANEAKQGVQSWRNYVVGHYTATGEDQEINVGFRPSFLIISGMGDTEMPNTDSEWTFYFGLTAGHAVPRRVGFTDRGFIVYKQTTVLRPDYSVNGKVYDYIAFK